MTHPSLPPLTSLQHVLLCCSAAVLLFPHTYTIAGAINTRAAARARTALDASSSPRVPLAPFNHRSTSTRTNGDRIARPADASSARSIAVNPACSSASTSRKSLAARVTPTARIPALSNSGTCLPIDAIASVHTVSGAARYARTSATPIPDARTRRSTITREIVRTSRFSNLARSGALTPLTSPGHASSRHGPFSTGIDTDSTPTTPIVRCTARITSTGGAGAPRA